MFRPYSLTSLAAWTAGALAGNQAYYSTRQKQEIQRAAGHLTDEYLQYGSFGGQLGVTDWLEQKKANLQLTPQEVATRAMILRFQGRKLSDEQSAFFVITHLNIFLSQNCPQYRAFQSLPYDFCDDETLWPIWCAFYKQLLQEGVENEEAIATALRCLSISLARVQTFVVFMKKQFALIAAQQRSASPAAEPRPAPAPQSAPAAPEPPMPVAKTPSTATPGPRTVLKDLYIIRESEPVGPYSYKQLRKALRAGETPASTLVAYDGAAEWITLEALIARVEAGR